MIKRQYILILLLVPSINIIASNILHYIEYALVPNTSTNWCIQFMFAMVYLIFDILHLSFSFVLPLILCKCKRVFSSEWLNCNHCCFSSEYYYGGFKSDTGRS